MRTIDLLDIILLCLLLGSAVFLAVFGTPLSRWLSGFVSAFCAIEIIYLLYRLKRNDRDA